MYCRILQGLRRHNRADIFHVVVVVVLYRGHVTIRVGDRNNFLKIRGFISVFHSRFLQYNIGFRTYVVF